MCVDDAVFRGSKQSTKMSKLQQCSKHQSVTWSPESRREIGN